MSSIIRYGDTYHGISVFGRGVFTNDEYGYIYAGQHRDGYACGLGVATNANGDKVYTEHGPDGQFDGRCLRRWTGGHTWYRLWERGKQKDGAIVFADGSCEYNGNACAPDDPRLLGLIAQIAPVEVRPAAPGPPPATRPQALARWIGRLVLPPQALAAAVATEVHPHAAHRRSWPCDAAQQQPRCQARPRSDACTDRFAAEVTRPHAPFQRLVHANGPVRAASCDAIGIVQHAATHGGLHVSVHTPHIAIFPHSDISSRDFLPGFAISILRSVWQAEEAVANLPLRLAVRAHCGHQVRRGSPWGTEEALNGFTRDSARQ
jgi:hypothetical protein